MHCVFFICIVEQSIMIADRILHKLELFTPISLTEMDEVKLLNRTDTKFVFSNDQLLQLLERSKNDYQILSISNQRFSNYKTVYFDTKECTFYHDHHNGKGNRYKVRMRKYVDSGLCFLEVKNKFKGRTLKSRTPIDDYELPPSATSQTFIDQVLGEQLHLSATLWNEFSRITLVNRSLKERLTIDLGLDFKLDSAQRKLNHTIIAEVKQERANRNSPMMTYLKEVGVRPMKISKYCIGCLLLDDELKGNLFKEKVLKIEKLENGVDD